VNDVSTIEAAAAEAAPVEAAPDRWHPPVPGRMGIAVIVLVLAAAIIAILYAWRLPPFGGRFEQTDDAYVRGQTTVISPQVSGYVSLVPVKDFQNVNAGDVLVRIEDSIYSARVAQARANVLTQMSNLENSDHQPRSSGQSSLVNLWTEALACG
jgi:multidrug resistance efflux pump